MREETSADDRDIFERTYDFVRLAVDRSAGVAIAAIAILMLLSAAIYVFRVYTGQASLTFFRSLGFMALAIAGVLILTDDERSLPRSVGLYAVGLGCYRALSVVGNLVPHGRMNILYYILIVLGINMMISGRAYIKGQTRARKTMIASSSCLLVINMIMIIYLNHSNNLYDVFMTYPMNFMLTILYFILILILDSDKLRRMDWLEVHGRTVDGIRRTYHLNGEASIYRSEWGVLGSGLTDASGWDPVADGGPAYRECHVSIRNGRGRSYITAQRWTGRDEMFLTVCDHPMGTVIQASRLTVTGIESDGDAVRLYSPDGTFIQLLLEDDPE